MNIIEYYKNNAPILRDEAERIADDCFTKVLLDIRSKGYTGQKLDGLLHPFRAIRMQLLALHLHFPYLQFQLTNHNWWRTTHHPLPSPPQILHMIESYDLNAKRGYIIGVFSVQEHILREYLRKIDNSLLNNATASYWKIRDYFLNKYIDTTNRKSFKNMLTLFAIIRNSFHNDSVFFPSDGKDIEIIYDETSYKFINGEPCATGEWWLLFKITEDLSDFLLEVVSNQNFLNDLSV